MIIVTTMIRKLYYYGNQVNHMFSSCTEIFIIQITLSMQYLGQSLQGNELYTHPECENRQRR